MDTTKKIQDNKYITIFVVAFVLAKLGMSETIKEQCYTENNTTLTCNYIPRTLTKQYEHVRIVDFKRIGTHAVLNSSSFVDESWTKVQTIEFNDSTGRNSGFTFSRMCFKGLISLRELKIHVSSFGIDTSAFVGLPFVHTLDVSKCYRLDIQDIINTLKVKNSLPRLQNIILSEIGAYLTNSLKQTDLQYLLQRNITRVDLSRTQMDFVNVTAVVKTLKTVEYVNISHSVIRSTWGSDIVPKDLTNLKVVDASYLVLPTKTVPIIPGRYVVINKTGKYSEATNLIQDIKSIFTPLMLNGSGILPSTMSFWIYNCTVIIDLPLDLKVEHLTLRKNNLKYIDVESVCPDNKLTSLLHLDLSDNELEMLHPTKCVPNLEIMILSNNKMFKMLEKRPNLFGNLFASHSKLRVVKLSNNYLPKLPQTMFKHNKNIEIIDLSFNELEQLHFELLELHHLRKLDVSNNRIKILDEVSIKNLDGVPNVDRCTVVMKSNPFLCSTCSCQSAIHWLIKSTLVNTDQQDLHCMDEGGTLINIDGSAVRKVRDICNRKVVTIVSTVCSVVTLLIVFMIGVVLYKRMKKRQRKKNMDIVINKLIAGNDQYEFAAFLSYNSNDEEFVQEHVINQLNENLQLMIGTDRNLVCTGDQYLRPGFMVLDEVELCLQRASVVIVLVSDNYCRSLYCRNEFEQAYFQRKPIVLMLLGNVNEDLMTPGLKRMYKRDVRVLWKFENDQFVLKTTWENICSSVLEKVQI